MLAKSSRVRKFAGIACAFALAAAAGAIAAPSAGQNSWSRDAIPAGGQPNMARSGDFAVWQIATVQPDQLMADWLKPTPGVAIPMATMTPRNRPIVTFIVFTGCRADAAGNCNVTVDFDTTDPAGKPYDHTNAEVWVGHPPPVGKNLQLSSGGLGLAFEAKDPLGAYQVRATVTDHVSGLSLHTEQVLTAVAG